MWLINIASVFLQLPAKEGFPVIRVICHESVILCHGSCKSRKRDKRPPSSRYKTYSPKYRIMVCPYFVSQQTELIQSETPPTSITDLICKGTWSINEDVLFERCCFPHFFIIIILLIYLFSGIKNPFLLLIRVYILAQTVGIPNAIQEESFCRKERNQEKITKISGLPNEA